MARASVLCVHTISATSGAQVLAVPSSSLLPHPPSQLLSCCSLPVENADQGIIALLQLRHLPPCHGQQWALCGSHTPRCCRRAAAVAPTTFLLIFLLLDTTSISLPWLLFARGGASTTLVQSRACLTPDWAALAAPNITTSTTTAR